MGTLGIPESHLTETTLGLQNYPVSRAARDNVASSLGEYGEDSSQLFKHVLISGALKPEVSRWVYLPESQIKTTFPGAHLRSLIGDGLLESTRQGSEDKLADYWRVPSPRYNGFCKALRMDRSNTTYDLFSGKPTTWTHRCRKYDRNRNPRPGLIREAMEALSKGRFSRPDLRQHFWFLHLGVISSNTTSDSPQTESPRSTLDREQCHNLRALQAQDLMCKHTLMAQDTQESDGPVRTYDLGYRVEDSGRFMQNGGGLQRCSEGMKVAAYSGVENTYRYRIKASIPTMLRDYMRERGWTSSFLNGYLQDDAPPAGYAKLVGLNGETWRLAFNALCLGADLPHPEHGLVGKNGRTSKDFSAPFERFLRKKYGSFSPDREYHEHVYFYNQVKDLYQKISRWRQELTAEWLPENAYPAGGDYWIRNDVGCSIKVPQHLIGEQRLFPYLPFLLRGREAHFIHTLTVEADKAGVEVISNEQDGIVTIGKIPADTLQSVKAKSPLDEAEVTKESLA